MQYNIENKGEWYRYQPIHQAATSHETNEKKAYQVYHDEVIGSISASFLSAWAVHACFGRQTAFALAQTSSWSIFLDVSFQWKQNM